MVCIRNILNATERPVMTRQLSGQRSHSESRSNTRSECVAKCARARDRWVIVGLLLVLHVWAWPAAAQQLVIPYLDGPILLDGMSDEAAWQEVEPILLAAHAPTFGGEPSERCEVLMGHDGRYLYVAARMFDSEPDRIQGLSLRRNDGSLANDLFAIVLDTFNDRETAVSFGTTPTGNRTDLAISNDAQAPTDLNFNWNTFWDVAAVRNDHGWFVEYRIPFSSLRFQDRNGQVTMGISFWRWIPRKDEYATFPARPPRWGFNSVLKPSLTQEVVLEGISSTRPLWVTPYVLGGGAQTFEFPESGVTYGNVTTPNNELGIDLKYGLTDNLTLDLAVNPDFAQVEADEQQTNLTRFSLFFPEKRLFFQERASAFEFSLGGADRLFHSRRIGLVAGEPVRILGGARVVGRMGDWDVGALNMQTGVSDGLPSENFGVLRLRRRVVNEHSHLGGMLTSRAEPRGAVNISYGMDGSLRLFDQDYLTLNWAQTFDSNSGVPDLLDRTFVRSRWERRGTEGFGYALELSHVGANFNPTLGFILRNGYTRFGERVYYGWRPGGDSRVFRHTIATNGSIYRRNADGSTETAEIAPQWQTEMRSGHTLTVTAINTYEDLEQSFSFSTDVELPAGRYWMHSGRLVYDMPWGAPLRTSARAEAGTFFDGSRISLGIFPTWRVSRHLELGGAYTLDRIRFEARDQQITAHVVRGRAQMMLTTSLSAATFVQYSSTANSIFTNGRFRYNPREGRDFYIVYNHGLHTDRGRIVPHLPLTDSQTLLVKYSHTFALGL
jgi:hypothetical protein